MTQTLEQFLASLPPRDQRLERADAAWQLHLETGEPTHIPTAMAAFAQAEVDAERERIREGVKNLRVSAMPSERAALLWALALIDKAKP